MPPTPSTTLANGPLSLLLKLHPAPTRLAESRSILRYLQDRFGRIDTFIEPRHNSNRSHNYIFAIFHSKESQGKALASSPLKIDVDVPKASSLSDSTSLKPPKPLSSQTPFYLPTKPKARPTTRVQYHCTILPSNHNHAESVKKNPFHGPYDVNRSTLTYQTLRNAGAPSESMADIQTKSRDYFSSSRREKMFNEVVIPPGGLMGIWRAAKQGMSLMEYEDKARKKKEDERRGRYNTFRTEEARYRRPVPQRDGTPPSRPVAKDGRQQSRGMQGDL